MTPPPIPAKRLREIALGLMNGVPLSFRRTSDLMRLAEWMEQQAETLRRTSDLMRLAEWMEQQEETKQPENVQAGID